MVKTAGSNSARNKRRDIITLLVTFIIIVLLNYLASFYFKRFDLTSEKRYTLAESTRTLLKNLNDEVLLKVYLDGSVNPGFARLRNEAKEILDEFNAYSDNQVKYEFIIPGEGLTREEAVNVERQLYNKGLVPEEISVKGKDKITQSVIWPGAIVSYKGKEAVWQIFTRQSPGITIDESINNSVEELEYSLTNTIRKLQRTKRAEVTFLHGHNELDTIRSYDFMRTLSEYYKVNIATITPGKELSSLKGSDALVIAKPDSSFTDKEKYVIDQFIMNGGKVLWLIDPVSISLDSIRRRGFTIGINRPLGIEELLFKYGVRLNPVIQVFKRVSLNCSFFRGFILPWFCPITPTLLSEILILLRWITSARSTPLFPRGA
jgi:ABC-2 type transport system permease protein